MDKIGRKLIARRKAARAAVIANPKPDPHSYLAIIRFGKNGSMTLYFPFGTPHDARAFAQAASKSTSVFSVELNIDGANCGTLDGAEA